MNALPAIEGVRAGKAARPATDLIARPLLYDIPELQGAHDALWAEVRKRVPALKRAASRLSRATDDWEDVVLGQVSGYRYATELTERASLIATPRYIAKGADGPFVRSAVLVRAKDAASGLTDLRGRSLALSATDLDSMNLLRAEAAPLALQGRFFGALHPQESFAAAVEAVAEGAADATLLDGVALALLERFRPESVKGLRVLLWTTRSPGPPLVAGRAVEIADIARALSAIAADPTFGWVRKDLLIAGFNPLPKAQYRAVAHLDQIAQSQGYPRLA